VDHHLAHPDLHPGKLPRGASGHACPGPFADRYPHAGGPEHYAAYLQDADGYEVELVAD
jgi:hypothetical protein